MKAEVKSALITSSCALIVGFWGGKHSTNTTITVENHLGGQEVAVLNSPTKIEKAFSEYKKINQQLYKENTQLREKIKTLKDVLPTKHISRQEVDTPHGVSYKMYQCYRKTSTLTCEFEIINNSLNTQKISFFAKNSYLSVKGKQRVLGYRVIHASSPRSHHKIELQENSRDKMAIIFEDFYEDVTHATVFLTPYKLKPRRWNDIPIN